MDTLYHRHFLMQALKLAEIRYGQTEPNPAVGAVLVKGEQVVAKGHHIGPGHPHAEVMALQQLDIEDEMVLYITLEPCCHHGRTPPCTDLIIDKGIKRVYFAALDPNPTVAGQGQALLRAQDIVCEQVVVPEIEAFYRYYCYWHRYRVPWVTAKIALSEDGKIAHALGRPAAITGEEARLYTHQQRQVHSAIVTTAQTVMSDDPQLTVRLGETVLSKPLFILDRLLRVSPLARLFQENDRVSLLHASRQFNAIEGVEYLSVPQLAGRLDLLWIMRHLAEAGCHSLWVEAGGQLLQSLLSLNMINELLVYIAPRTLGDAALSVPVTRVPCTRPIQSIEVLSLGKDQLIRWCFASS